MSSCQHKLPLRTGVSDTVSTHRHRRSSGDAAVRAVSTRSAPAETADNTHHHTPTTKHVDQASETKRQINKPPLDSATDSKRRAAEFRMKLKATIEKRKKMTPEERDATSWGGVPRSETSPQDAYKILMETFGSI